MNKTLEEARAEVLKLEAKVREDMLAAVRDLDSSNWEIGDALLAECGPPGNNEILRKASAYLLEEGGVEYDVERLSELRRVAYAFPVSERRAEYCWVIHREAGSPEMLAWIIAGTPKGTVIDLRHVKEVVRAWKFTRAFEHKWARRLESESCASTGVDTA
jgi:hypothetical protein